MKNRTAGALAFVLLGLGLLATPGGTGVAAAAETVAAAPLEISVEGVGDARVTPDMAYVWIGAETRGDSASAAQRQSAAIVNRLLAVLTRYAPEERIKTVEFSLYRMDFWSEKEQRSVPGDFVIRHIFEVPLKDLSQVAAVIDEGIDAGATVVQNVQYSVQDPIKAQDEALQAAYEDALHKARLLAARSGYVLAGVTKIQESSVSEPIFAAEGGAVLKAAPSTFMPGQLKINARLSITFRAVPAGAGEAEPAAN
jgi:hypothetical protein